MEKTYMCIDLKSFYASVECHERGLDPLNTYLVVADQARTEKTICLAVSAPLKAYGLSGRCRLFEALSKVKEVNYQRKKANNYKPFIRKSYIDSEVKQHKNIELDFIKAVPRMKLYIKYSVDIYNIYLKYIAPEDILVYSIDEVFCDITGYLKIYQMSKEEFATKIIEDVYKRTGITATAGIGSNMYLAKVAMDITAKHMNPNKYGVRVATLNEESYKRLLWNHRPLSDFWRIGAGISKKLEANGMYTMGDVARMSLNNENLLFKLFGVNAEFLIDHAWGYEPCTIWQAKNYKPRESSISQGQVLHCPYNFQKASLIVKEMTDLLVLDLVKKHQVTDQIVLNIIYDIDNLKSKAYDGPIVTDYYGRKVPKPARGTIKLDHKTSSTKIIMEKVLELYRKIVNQNLLIRKINITFGHIKPETEKIVIAEQMDLFTNYIELEQKRQKETILEQSEKKVQKAIIAIQNKYGKNALLKGMNLEIGATTRERNQEIGGHRG